MCILRTGVLWQLYAEFRMLSHPHYVPFGERAKQQTQNFHLPLVSKPSAVR